MRKTFLNVNQNKFPVRLNLIYPTIHFFHRIVVVNEREKEKKAYTPNGDVMPERKIETNNYVVFALVI